MASRKQEVMTLDSVKIKEALQAKAGGTLELAARRLSNKEYSFSASTLSKVIHGKRTSGKATRLIQLRIEKLLGERVFGYADDCTQNAETRNAKCV